MQQTAQQPKTPVMVMIGPAWFHDHGHKMRLRHVDVERGMINLEASAASVQIFRGAKEALVDWEVIYSPGSKVQGRISLSLAQLAAAFEVPWDEHPCGIEYSQWLLDRFGGDCAIQGCFIRFKEFLNIPGPGTGHDGDPNVSVMVDKEIREAVRDILNW